MDSHKLIYLGQQILAEENDFAFQQKITDLRDLYSQSKGDPNVGPNIEGQLRHLTDTVNASPVNDLQISYAKIQAQTNGDKYTGNGIIASIEEIIRSNQFNIDNIVNQLNTYINQRQEYITRISTLVSTLSQLNITYTPNTELYDLGILIPDKNELTTIPKIEKQLHNWNILLKQLSELTGQGAADLKISKVSNGSIELYVQHGVEVIECIGTMIAKIGVIYLTINEIRKHREALKKLKAPSAETKEIEKHEKGIIDDEINKTAEEIISKYEKTIPKGRKDELNTAIVKGMRFIARTIDNGIEVEIIPPAFEAPEPKTESDDEETIKRKDAKNIAIEKNMERAQIIKKAGSTIKGLSGLGDSAFKMLTGGDDELDK